MYKTGATNTTTPGPGRKWIRVCDPNGFSRGRFAQDADIFCGKVLNYEHLPAEFRGPEILYNDHWRSGELGRWASFSGFIPHLPVVSAMRLRMLLMN
ncbi:hypothetical protein NDU88_004493 [Pleurodeles waltl]|uniref:Uncharacterized protein n=1 Tax=Pleurodeles waltl TaxID=8319 RepID=A0AAV7TTQ2_PLEWA|nr:hypothetical protein NDU88_004493 [Pleurodeles waltl]